MKTLLLFLFAVAAFGQFQLVRQPDPTTVAGLPTASTNTRRIYIVTDGQSASDCSVGGGSTRAICISNGTSWTATAGGSGSITGCGFGQTLNGTVCDTNTAVIPSNVILQSGAPLYCAGSASTTATCGLNSALTAYTTGMVINFKAGATNTTTYTLNIDGQGAKSILTAAGAALSAGDITSGRYYELTYDGTQFLLPPSGGASAPTPMFRQLTTVDDSTATDYNTALTRSVIDGFPVFTSSLTGGASQGRVFSLGSTFDKKFAMFAEFGAGGDGHAGVIMTDGTRAMTCGYRYNNAAGTAGIAGLEFFAYNQANATTYTGAITPAAQMTAFQYRGRVLLTPIYMRVIRDATNLTCQTSPDGIIWMNFATQTTAAFIAAVGGTGPTSAGIWIREGGTSASTRIYWKGYE